MELEQSLTCFDMIYELQKFIILSCANADCYPDVLKKNKFLTKENKCLIIHKIHTEHLNSSFILLCLTDSI